MTVRAVTIAECHQMMGQIMLLFVVVFKILTGLF